MRWNKLPVFVGIGLAWLAAARPAAAQVCTISTPSNVVFSTYDVYGALPVDTTGTVRIRCNSFARTVIVDLSDGNATNFSPRYMLKGIEHLNYNLYLDAARTTIWGNNTNGSSHYGPTDPPNNTDVNIPIYGRVNALQDVSAGAYTDSIVATVNF